MSLLQEAKGLLAATEDGAAECWAQRNLCQTAASALALLAAMVAELERLERKQAATLECLVGCVNQGAIQRSDGLIDHSFLSAYEDAFAFLGLPEDGCTREQLWAVLKTEAAR